MSTEKIVGQFKMADSISKPAPLTDRKSKASSAARSPSNRVLQDNRDAAPKLSQSPTVQRNNTGLPDKLKSGIESLSGYSMDDVKVHYNSSKPAQLNAHAYAQGSDIHLGVGQEKHLPHEAWHVVQQKQGRVKATMQMKEGVGVNDDAGLEREADVMGEKALQFSSRNNGASHAVTNIQRMFQLSTLATSNGLNSSSNPIQSKTILGVHTDTLLNAGHQYTVNLGESGKKKLTYQEQGRSGFFRFTDNEDKNYWLPGYLKIEKTTPEESLESKGFVPTEIDWSASLAIGRPSRYEEWAFKSVKDLSVSWDEETEKWDEVRVHTRAISIFPALETDLIVENSNAYIAENGIYFIFGNGGHNGYFFGGNPKESIKLLAFKYSYINEAPAPRSGKARAASDDLKGSLRLPADNEAAYHESRGEMVSGEGEMRIDTGTKVTAQETSNGSMVTVTHTAPWKKGGRGAGQSSAMGGQNAKNYIVDHLPNPDRQSKAELKNKLGGRYEWLHVVGSSLGGINIKQNLVAGSYDANTKMIALEHRVARWGVRDYKGEQMPSAEKPITIVGVAKTAPGTRIGRSIALDVLHGTKKIVSGIYNVEDQHVITKSEYKDEEARVEDDVISNR